MQSSIVTYDAAFNATTKHRGPYVSVADAYADVESLLGGTALTAAQKAAITVTPTYQTAGDSSTPVIAYTISLKGHYAQPFTMRLGDLQRSAIRILTVASKSTPFAQLAKLQHVSGIHVGPYSDQAGNLRAIVTSWNGRVVKP